MVTSLPRLVENMVVHTAIVREPHSQEHADAYACCSRCVLGLAPTHIFRYQVRHYEIQSDYWHQSRSAGG